MCVHDLSASADSFACVLISAVEDDGFFARESMDPLPPQGLALCLLSVMAEATPLI